MTESLVEFFNNSFVYYCVLDSEYKFLLVNPAFEQRLGYAYNDMLGKSFIDFLHENDRVQTLKVMQSIKEDKGYEVPFESRICSKFGIYFKLSWSCFCRNGKTYVSGRYLNEDSFNTPEKKARRIANLSLLAMSKMVGGIAHEINNPLAIIHGRANMFKNLISEKNDLNRDDLISMVSAMEETSLRIAKILQNLRVFAHESNPDLLEDSTLKKKIESALSEELRDFQKKQ